MSEEEERAGSIGYLERWRTIQYFSPPALPFTQMENLLHCAFISKTCFFFFFSKLNFPNFPLVDTSVRVEIQSVIQLGGPAAGPLLSELLLLFSVSPIRLRFHLLFYIRRRKNSTQTQSANIKAKHEHTGPSSHLFFFFTPNGPAGETKATRSSRASSPTEGLC